MGRSHEGTSDRALVAAIADGADRAAFAELFRRYAPRLRGFLLRGALTEEWVEELVQEVMLQAWHKASRYDPQRAAVSTWLFTIARNRYIDRVRKHARAVPEGFEDVPPAPGAPDELVGQGRRARRLHDALAALPEEQQVAIREVFFHHRTHAEAAVSTDVPEGTQKSRVRAALRALRERLAGEEEP